MYTQYVYSFNCTWHRSKPRMIDMQGGGLAPPQGSTCAGTGTGTQDASGAPAVSGTSTLLFERQHTTPLTRRVNIAGTTSMETSTATITGNTELPRPPMLQRSRTMPASTLGAIASTIGEVAKAKPLRSERIIIDSSLRLRATACTYYWELDCASCMAILPDSNLLIADTGSHSLIVISGDDLKVSSTLVSGHIDIPLHSLQSQSGGAASTQCRMRGPRGLAVSGSTVFVADCYNCCVRKFRLADGALLATVGCYGDGDGQMRYPHGLALAEEVGLLFVADTANGRIVAFAVSDLSYRFAFALEPGLLAKAALELLPRRAPSARRGGSSGHVSSGPLNSPASPGKRRRGPERCRPAGLAVYEGELFVADAYNRRLQVFGVDGTFRRFLVPLHFEGAHRGLPLLTLPEGVCVLDGRLIVSDRRGDAVHVLATHDGQPLQQIAFQMNRPHGLCGVAADSKGRLFVLDEVRNEIQVLTSMVADARVEGRTLAKAKDSERGATPRATAHQRPTPRATPRPTPRTTPRPAGPLSQMAPRASCLASPRAGGTMAQRTSRSVPKAAPPSSVAVPPSSAAPAAESARGGCGGGLASALPAAGPVNEAGGSNGGAGGANVGLGTGWGTGAAAPTPGIDAAAPTLPLAIPLRDGDLPLRDDDLAASTLRLQASTAASAAADVPSALTRRGARPGVSQGARPSTARGGSHRAAPVSLFPPRPSARRANLRDGKPPHKWKLEVVV